MTAGFLREGDSSPKPFQNLSLGRPDCSWDDDNYNTSQAEVIHQTRGQPKTPLCLKKKKAETILEDSEQNPLSSFTVQNDWNRFLALSEAAKGVTLKRERQGWKCKKKVVHSGAKRPVKVFILPESDLHGVQNSTWPHTVGTEKLRNIWGNHFLSTDPWKTEGWNIWGRIFLWHRNNKKGCGSPWIWELGGVWLLPKVLLLSFFIKLFSIQGWGILGNVETDAECTKSWRRGERHWKHFW